MNNLSTQTVQTMSSLEIAKLTEKRHDNVMRDIESTLVEVGIGALKFEGTYLDVQGKQRPCYNLPRRECDLIIAGYSAKYRLAIIDRWRELEAVQQTSFVQLSPRAHANNVLKDALETFSIFQVPLHIAQSESVKITFKETGVSFHEELKLAPAQSNILPEDEFLEPTELAKVTGVKSTIALNQILESRGIQVKVGGEWLPTDTFKEHAIRHAWSVGAKSGYNLKWRKSFILGIF